MLAFACQNAASARQVGQAARASTRRGGSLPRQPDDHVAVAARICQARLYGARTRGLLIETTLALSLPVTKSDQLCIRGRRGASSDDR